MSAFRRKPYRRGDHVNIIPNRDDDDKKPPVKGCPYCDIVLHYDQKREMYWCLHCGWNIPIELQEDLERKQQQPNIIKLKTATSANKDFATSDPTDNIPIASKGSRTEEQEEKRRYPFQDIMDADDRKYIREGHTLIDLKEEFHDDHTTISADELERQRLERQRNKRRRRI